MIDLSRAIKYPFSGPSGVTKTLIGGLMVLMMPVFFLTGLVLLGYQVRVIRDVIDERDDEAPEWDNYGADFVQGIVIFLGTVLYYLPSIILVGLSASLLYQTLAGLDGTDLILQRESVTWDRPKLAMMVLTFALALIWLLLSAPLVMAAIARYAETGEFAAFTNVLTLADEVWEQRAAAGRLMLNLFLLTILAQTASMLLSMTCLAGAFIQYIQFAATCHLTGQWGALLKANRPKPSVIRPLTSPRR